MPTADQMKAILAAAPPELQQVAKPFVDAYIAAGDSVGPSIFGQFADQLATIDQFDADHCGLPLDDEEAPDPAVVSIAPNATRVDVVATDFHFEFTPPTKAGRYSFVMENQGSEDHMMILAQLEPGVTMDQVMASNGEEGVAQEFSSVPSAKGGESVVTADLTAGTWYLVCPLPSAANDGEPHAALGMVHEFTVS
jgi:hypothetical protein